MSPIFFNQLRQVLGDGNCQFRALADQLAPYYDQRQLWLENWILMNCHGPVLFSRVLCVYSTM